MLYGNVAIGGLQAVPVLLEIALLDSDLASRLRSTSWAIYCRCEAAYVVHGGRKLRADIYSVKGKQAEKKGPGTSS